MSRLDEYKEVLKSKLATVWEKIQESPLYNQLNDRYQSLTATGQKAVQVTSGLVILLLFFYSPLSQIMTSSGALQEFELNRNLIRDLFKTYHESSAGASLNPAPATAELISTVQNALQNAHLLPEQIIGVESSQAEGRLIPAQLLSEVVEVKLSKLNLRQIVDIGSQLVNISYSVKVKDMTISAHPDMAGYFDVNYKMYALKVPEAPPEPAPEPEPKKSKKKTDSKIKDEKADE